MPNRRSLYLIVAAICFALIGAALYLQHVQKLAPCPLCVIQRYAFLAAGIFSLAAAFVPKERLWAALGLASLVGGLGTAGKHVYVLANPGFTCGIDPVENFLNKLPTAEIMPWMFEAYGACEEAHGLFGLSLPAWAAVWFVLLGAALLALVVKRR
jgi:protein dithiol:quinone oxidoreductase